ncbi:MAG: hypothetical protein OSA98_25670, partial [Rubripirellula sp.]|nr:hypothetical protein [Rubripirellula sp.]
MRDLYAEETSFSAVFRRQLSFLTPRGGHMSSACVLWFPWPHLRSGVRQINQLDGIEYVAAGAA